MTLKAQAALAAIAGLLAAGCANDGTLTTAAITPKPAESKVAAVDPACATLASQIDTLRKDGSVERLEKAAAGKGKSVEVKRDALAKQAELNKANAEFQAKCGPKLPAATTAQAAPAPAGTATAAASKAATSAAPAPAPAVQPTAAASAQQTAKAAAKDAVKQP